MLLIDTHAHLYDEAFDGDLPEVMDRAAVAGVGKMLLPAIDSHTHQALLRVCGEYPGRCLPMMGLHPTSVNDNPEWRRELELVEKYLAEPTAGKFYAVGEVGLDFYWSKDFVTEQMEAFEYQVGLSLKYDLPLVIHTRNAWDKMEAVLGRYKGRGLRGVMHAFSGSFEEYERIRKMGDFVFGLGGVVTYKNSSIGEVVRRMDLDEIVLETDCPYLTPVPFRGKRNESSYITYICAKVAELTGRSVEQVAATTSANAARIFGI